MEPLILTARAKINLTLDVLFHRRDGYHEIETIMQQIDLADYLYVEPLDDGIIELSCSNPEVPLSPENLVYKAVKLLSFPGENLGVKIYIKKNIPVGAGLAGGSTNAAAALVALNFLWDRGFSLSELMDVSVNIGADVPFCLMGGTVLARGKGEQLTKLSAIPPFKVIIAKVPGLSISTGSVYNLLKVEEIKQRPITPEIIKAIQRGDRKEILSFDMVNVLEEVVLSRYPETANLKNYFHQMNLKGVISGSGPTVFALCEEESRAREAVSMLKKEGYEVWFCNTCDVKAEL